MPRPEAAAGVIKRAMAAVEVDPTDVEWDNPACLRERLRVVGVCLDRALELLDATPPEPEFIG